MNFPEEMIFGRFAFLIAEITFA